MIKNDRYELDTMERSKIQYHLPKPGAYTNNGRASKYSLKIILTHLVTHLVTIPTFFYHKISPKLSKTHLRPILDFFKRDRKRPKIFKMILNISIVSKIDQISESFLGGWGFNTLLKYNDIMFRKKGDQSWLSLSEVAGTASILKSRKTRLINF